MSTGVSYGARESSGGASREKTVLVTGAAGYIGSHVCLELLQEGMNVIGLDNLSTGSREALRRVQSLAGRDLQELVIADIGDRATLDACFSKLGITDVIHLAGLKSVAESMSDPISYMQTNVGGTAALLDTMEHHDVRRIVFSSSCTVYGDPRPEEMPLTETHPLRPTTPYGRSKLTAEQLLIDVCNAKPTWGAISLRYFNPIGAHESGRIGEDQRDHPTNLLPMVMQVVTGQRSTVTVFGADYPTPDGTCVRDYIHVSDLARAHVLALEAIERGHEAINLATGTGTSVLEVLKAVEASVGATVPYDLAERRPGDAVVAFAAGTLAETRLGWTPQLDLQRMCDDHWRWHKKNPDGYVSSDEFLERRSGGIDLRRHKEERRSQSPIRQAR